MSGENIQPLSQTPHARLSISALMPFFLAFNLFENPNFQADLKKPSNPLSSVVLQQTLALEPMSSLMRPKKYRGRHIRRTFLTVLFSGIALFAQNGVTRTEQSYFETLNKLSPGTITERWRHPTTPYFQTNEQGFNALYARLKHSSSNLFGTSLQQNFSLLYHLRPQTLFICDINPGVTEILLPIMGQFIEESNTRAEFLSRLSGVPLTDENIAELIDLSQGRRDATLQAHLSVTWDHIVRRIPEEQRNSRLRQLKALFISKIPPQIRTPALIAEVSTWTDALTYDFMTGAFLMDAAHASWNTAVNQVMYGGWLSSETAFLMVKEYWTSGRILGITADITGPFPAKLVQWLKERDPDLKREFSVFYVSNIGASTSGRQPPQFFRKMYDNLSEIANNPNAQVILAIGPGPISVYVLPLQTLRWIYTFYTDNDSRPLYRILEIPLSTNLRGEALWRYLRKELSDNEPLLGLVNYIEKNLNSPIPLAQFLPIAHQFPSVNTASGQFQALVSLLVCQGVVWITPNDLKATLDVRKSIKASA